MRQLFGCLLVVVSIFSVSWAYADESALKDQKILVSVGKENGDSEWAKTQCQNVHQALAIAARTRVDVNCVWLKNNEFISEALQSSRKSGAFKYYVDFRELKDHDSLRFVNLIREDDQDFQQVGWNISKKADLLSTMSGLLTNVFRVEWDKHDLKAYFVAQAAAESKTIDLNKNGQFVDRLSGDVINSEKAYKQFVGEGSKQKHYIRAAVEIAALLGTATYSYHVHNDTMAKDWDYPTVHDSLNAKIFGTKGVRFDDNGISINRNHAFAGMLYYLSARSNNLSAMESFLVTFAASSFWEYVTEYREVTSINDQIVTSVGGAVIGETLHQIAKALRKPGSGVLKRTFAAIFDSPGELNGFIDRHLAENKNAVDLSGTGWENSFWSEFDLEASIVHSSKQGADPNAIRIGMDAKVINIPMFDEPGQVKEILTDTAFSQLIINATANGGAPNEFVMIAKTAFAAYHQKKIKQNEDGTLSGFNLWIGPSSAVEFRDDSLNGHRDDFEGTINVLGTQMQITAYTHGAKITADLEIYGDFAMMKSYMIEKYIKDNGAAGLPTVAADNDYYYGVGYTTRGQLIVEYGRVKAGASLSDTEISALKNRYRFPEKITNFPDMNDSRIVGEAFVSYKIGAGFEIRFSVQRIHRAGEIAGYGSGSSNETRYIGSLIYEF